MIANNRYDQAIKKVLVAAGGTGFTYAACSAPEYAAGTAYQAGSQVSYDKYAIIRHTFLTLV